MAEHPVAQSVAPSEKPKWTRASAMRSRIVIEIAAELVTADDQPHRQAKVDLREAAGDAWAITLFGNSTMEGLQDVIAGRATLSMINPAGILSLAYRGADPFDGPQPVRAIGVIPSLDQFVFAAKTETGLTTLEDIARLRFPLRVSLRAQKDHCMHLMLGHIMAAAGCPLDDLIAWGGEARYELIRRQPIFAAVERGDADAIFEEAVQDWVEDAVDAGMTILSLGEETVAKLEAMGYRRGIIRKDRFPKLPNDILTIDFSGWPIYVREDLDDRLVGQICAALDARKHLIPWQGEGPLPVERMCRDAEDTPMDVPLHRAAERAWRERGYLD